MKNWLDKNSYNALCDSCGRKFKASQLLRRWDGLYVCKQDYETRHPQDFLRVQKEKISVPWSRPYSATDTYINTCDLWSSSPMADFGTADCATLGGNTNIALLISLFNPYAVADYAIAGRSIPGVLHT